MLEKGRTAGFLAPELRMEASKQLISRQGELVTRGGVQGSEEARNPHIPASAAPVSWMK
jgi:hypothetical protein